MVLGEPWKWIMEVKWPKSDLYRIWITFVYYIFCWGEGIKTRLKPDSGLGEINPDDWQHQLHQQDISYPRYGHRQVFFEEQQQHLDFSRFFLESIEESAVEKYPRVLQCKSPHTSIHGEEILTWNLNLMWTHEVARKCSKYLIHEEFCHGMFIQLMKLCTGKQLIWLGRKAGYPSI